MNAIQILRGTHADTKMRLKLILGADDPRDAAKQWRALQPILELHEQLEDQRLYTPLAAEMSRGTPLGDWDQQHDADVTAVKQLFQVASELAPGTPAWRTCIGTIMDTLHRHVMVEEGQIFPRIEQAWGSARLEDIGQQMQAPTPKTARAKPTTATTARRRR